MALCYEAACMVSGSLPWEMAAGLYTEMYELRTARHQQALEEGRVELSAHTRKVEARQSPPPAVLVQVLTSNGCLGEYLHRIQREPTTSCHHCGASSDTAEHTLDAECPEWEVNHRALWDATGVEEVN
ncbi:uncharacterized protein [Anoplolepis gracilipes]|uniref:uncharacterized protein n=1 Tax=Anoplolepis gracilipes TaxID=354296 RepID=UPI003B9E6A64